MIPIETIQSIYLINSIETIDSIDSIDSKDPIGPDCAHLVLIGGAVGAAAPATPPQSSPYCFAHRPAAGVETVGNNCVVGVARGERPRSSSPKLPALLSAVFRVNKVQDPIGPNCFQLSPFSSIDSSAIIGTIDSIGPDLTQIVPMEGVVEAPAPATSPQTDSLLLHTGKWFVRKQWEGYGVWSSQGLTPRLLLTHAHGLFNRP